jgi:RNA recognition motif-containing protein
MYFSKYGEIVNLYCPKDTATKATRGFSFITFSHSDAINAVMAQPHHYFDGKLLFVSKAVATKAQLLKRGMTESDYEVNRFAIL